MLDRSLRAAVALGLVLAASSVALDAEAAGKKDKEALKLHDQAMDEHYLSVEFDKAAEKLEKAISTCGESNCSPEVLGKLFVALGTVHGVGQGQLDVALEDFKKAIAAHSGAKLIEGLTTPELEEKFKEAQAAGGGAPAEGEGEEPEGEGESEASGDFPHEAVGESAVNTPIPVYVKIPDELGATKVVVRYKPFGGDKWKSVNLERSGAGFGGYIPCTDVTTTGEVRYHVIATDESGSPVATAGSAKQPYKVQVKNKIAGDAPSLPGEDAPKKCMAKEDCPPGLPGCGPAGGARGDKGWGASCEATPECQSGLVCLNGTCEEGDDEGGSSSSGTKTKGARNLIPVGVQFDLLMLSSGENVCSPTSGDTYACFESGTSRQYYGFPDVVPEQNGISGGIAMAGVRVLAGYERFLIDGLGLTVGAKVGIAFGGSPSPDNAPPTCTEEVLDGEACDEDSTPLPYQTAGQAQGFLPLHLEARASYYFLSDGGVEKGGFYPYGFVGGGVAQVNAGVEVAVCNGVTGERSTPCPDPKQLDAYQLTGLGFIGFGGGATYFFHENVGAQAELKMMVMLPTTGFVLAPTLGPVFAF